MIKVHSHRAILLKDLHIQFRNKRRLRIISYLKLKGLLKNWVFWLILITGIAIVIRSIPAWTNAAWGCDFGIYLGLTEKVATSGELFPQYYGWGGSYNYFPVLYAVNAFAHWVTGIDIVVLMPKLTPIFGGLVVLIFYFVVYKLTENKKIAIISALLLSVLPFHVYQLSHASPLTMGHFFMMLCIYLFIKFREKSIYAIPLIISTILLIMSHHLTTYFYLIVMVFIVFFENASQDKWTSSIKKDVFYILLTSALVFSYWAFVATPVFESFMSQGFNLGGIKMSSTFTIALFYVVFFGLFGVARLIRRFSRYLERAKKEDKNHILKNLIWIVWKINPFIKKPQPTIKSRFIRFALVMIICLGAMIYYLDKPLPWADFPFTTDAMILSIPLLVIFAFGVAGFRFTSYIKNGFFIRGWLLAIVVSFVFALVTQNTTLFPHRHFEYLMAPVAIVAAYGIGAIFSDPEYKVLLSKLKSKESLFVNYRQRKIAITRKRRQIHVVILLVLFISLAGSVYPSHRALNQSWEEITTQDVNSIEWMAENLDKNVSLITSDHRLERMMEAEGFNTTQDKTVNLWDTENINQYILELIGIGTNYSRITHIVIDDIMKEQGVHIGPKQGNFRTIHMTNETWKAAYEKFSELQFEQVYRNETIEIDSKTLEPLHWTEVYEVNWTYIEEIYLPSIENNI